MRKEFFLNFTILIKNLENGSTQDLKKFSILIYYAILNVGQLSNVINGLYDCFDTFIQKSFIFPNSANKTLTKYLASEEEKIIFTTTDR